jgi:hypothetical protein
MQFLPRRNEIAAWELTDDPLVVPADELDGVIDTDADHFRRFEVLDVTMGTYQHTGGDGGASVEIFRFPDFIKAFGAYTTRRSGMVRPLNIENEGFVARRSLHVWRGPFYIRIFVWGGAELLEPVEQLARAVAERMPRADGKPAAFRFLPDRGRVPNSETYSVEGMLGQPYLSNAFGVSYEFGAETADGMILPAPSRQAAAQIVDQLRNLFVTNGRLLDPIANLGEDNFTAEDRHLGRIVVFRIDRFVVAFRGYGSRALLLNLAIEADQRIINTIRTQLKAAEKAAQAAQRATPAPPPRDVPPWQREE